jgi:hypothetical protein
MLCSHSNLTDIISTTSISEGEIGPTTLFGAPKRTVGIFMNGPGLSQLSTGLGYNIKSRS